MSALTRQNTLFVAEDWVRIYEALENVDFRAYDFDNLVQALFQYLKSNYPEQFNDWVASSEFVTKVEILAWLSQNISFRIDLNARENFLATAERRDSLIRLAQNIGYKMNRVRSASGYLKIKSIRTTESVVDSNGTNLRNRNVIWNDPRDEDWYERFILVMNSAFITRTQFGFPLSQNSTDGIRIDQYVFNSSAPISGAYRFNSAVNGIGLQFDIYNGSLDASNGVISEIPPNADNSFHVFYILDGKGFNSTQTGFFLPFKQGNLRYQDNFFTNPEVIRTLTLPSTNINNDDFFVQQIDASGNVLENWTQVDTIFGEGVSFNTLSGTTQSIYELDSLVNDQVRVRFGDGTFGNIPVGRFRFWYRTANPTPTPISPTSIQNQSITIPYINNDQLYQLTLTYSLENTVSNGSVTETNFDIRNRAGKVFYTQNRMITGQDYNNFFLKDNSIKKVKTINRSFSGQSRYSRLTDATGLYQNVRHVASDGRLYQDFTTTIETYSADQDVLTTKNLISQYINPLIRKEDKRILYFNTYTEIIITNSYKWSETSIVAGQSRGNLELSNVPQIVGENGSGVLSYVDSDSVLRFTSPLGTTVVVDRIIEDGTADDGIILKDTIENGLGLFSVFPALRNRFTDDEHDQLEDRLNLQLDFALSWKQSTQSWEFINAENINRTSTFDLQYQGETSGAGLDASWMILFEFLDNQTWKITDRGMSMFFESAREVDFIFTNNNKIIDPETGRTVFDTVSLLECNESRDSLRRRGLDTGESISYDFKAYEFLGDGSTTCFRTKQIPLLAESTVVLVNDIYQVHGVDYIINPSVEGYEVCFITAPADQAAILIYYSSRFRNGTLNVQNFISDGTTDEFDLGITRSISPSNVIACIDGVIQNSNVDFGIGTAISGNTSIVFNEIIGSGASISVFFISDIDNAIFNKAGYVADGIRTDFDISTVLTEVPLAPENYVFVSIDGVLQNMTEYNLVMTGDKTTISFVTPPPEDTRVRIISVANPTQSRSYTYQFNGDGFTTIYALDENDYVDNDNSFMIIAIDGVVQDGPWTSNPKWIGVYPNKVQFTTAPPDDTVISVFHLLGTGGVVCDFHVTPISGMIVENPPLNVESNFVNFLGTNVDFIPNGVIRHVDGYVNKNGLSISPIDADSDGVFDNPLIFQDLVIQDGITDLVLWRKIQEFGFSVWDPINRSTAPRGTYGKSSQTGIELNDDVNLDTQSYGDIHYDISTDTWLTADVTTGKWIMINDQSLYQAKIGRDHLHFIWTHYAPDANRIDPSKSNIMNVFILTSGYDEAYRNWLSKNGSANDEPETESSDQLRIQYSDYENYKPISDAIIYYPARYKPLFGDRAITELRSVFKVIQTKGSTLSESDLKLRILNAIDAYFDVDRWEFGEKFYFTELVAFVHAQLAPDLQSMVIVPVENTQAFGRMFQVRAEPDELFISAANPEDIQVVPFFTDEEIRVGTLI